MRSHNYFKILFVFLIFGLCSASGVAQLRYGFRLGGDFAATRLTDAEGYSLVNKSGFSGGLILEYQFSKNGFAPDIGLLYGRHNTRLRYENNNPFGFGRNFIDIPIHLKYKFWLKPTHNTVAPLVYAGPTFSFKLDHKGSQPLDTKIFQPTVEVGIGFDIVNFIQITAGYHFGIGNAVKSFDMLPDARITTNGWNLSANLLFDF
ncbi:MAG: outer membrane beta-barrel protein [Muribaculaceae bacterium]|nr:outer membrane beta-barrel protein [Muribaculaceae bacterium]